MRLPALVAWVAVWSLKAAVISSRGVHNGPYSWQTPVLLRSTDRAVGWLKHTPTKVTRIPSRIADRWVRPAIAMSHAITTEARSFGSNNTHWSFDFSVGKPWRSGVADKAIEGNVQTTIRSIVSNPKSTVTDLLALCDLYGSSFDAENCAAVLNKLSKRSPQDVTLRERLIRDVRFERLLALTDRVDVRWTPKACSLVLNAFSWLVDPGMLHEKVPVTRGTQMVRSVIDKACRRLQDQADELAPRHVSLSLNALAKLGVDPEMELMTRLSGRAWMCASAFPPQELATAINALGRLQHAFQPPVDMLGALEQRACRLMDDFHAQDLANTVHGFGKLGHAVSSAFLQRCEVCALATLHAFKPAELAMASQGFNKLGMHRPSEGFLRAWVDAVWSAAPYMSTGELAMAMRGVAGMGHQPNAAQLQDFRAWVERRVHAFSCGELASMASALAKMEAKGPHAEVAVHIMFNAAASRLQEFRGKELASLLHSMGQLDHRASEEFVLRALSCLDQRLHECDVKALANLVAGLGRLGFYPGAAFAARIRSRLLSELSCLNPRDQVDILAGWAELGHNLDTELLANLLPQMLSSVDSFSVEGLVRVSRALSRLDGLIDAESIDNLAQAIYTRTETLPLNDALRVTVALAKRDMVERVVLEDGTQASAKQLPGGIVAVLGRVRGRVAGLNPCNVPLIVWLLTRLPASGTVGEDAALKEQTDDTMLEEDGSRVREDFSGLQQGLRAEVEACAAKHLAHDHLSPDDMARLASGLLHLSHPPPSIELIQQLQQSTLRWINCPVQTLPLPPLASVINALQVLNGQVDAEVVSAFATRVMRTCPTLAPTASHDLAGALNTLARMQSTTASLPTGLWTAIDAAIEATAGAASPSAVVLTLNACVQLKHVPTERALQSLAAAALRQMSDFSTGGLVSVLDAFEKLRHYPGEAFMDSLLSCLTKRMSPVADDGPGATSLAAVTRVLIHFQHHPGPDFLSALEVALTPLVAAGRRVAWASMALGAFGHKFSPEFLSALLASVEHRRRSMSLAQLGAVLWGVAVGTCGQESEGEGTGQFMLHISRLDSLVEEASDRMESGVDPHQPGLVAGHLYQDGDGAEKPADGCSVDAMTVHSRLRQVGGWAGLMLSGRSPVVVDRFVGLVDGWAERCLVDDEDVEPVPASVPRLMASMEGAGWSVSAPRRTIGRTHVLPDLVMVKEGGEVAVAVVPKGQCFDRNAPTLLLGAAALRTKVLSRKYRSLLLLREEDVESGMKGADLVQRLVMM